MIYSHLNFRIPNSWQEFKWNAKRAPEMRRWKKIHLDGFNGFWVFFFIFHLLFLIYDSRSLSIPTLNCSACGSNLSEKNQWKPSHTIGNSFRRKIRNKRNHTPLRTLTTENWEYDNISKEFQFELNRQCIHCKYTSYSQSWVIFIQVNQLRDIYYVYDERNKNNST